MRCETLDVLKLKAYIGTGFMMNIVVAFRSGDQSSMCFNLPANGGTIFADVLGDLGYLKPFLESCLNRQSVIS